MVFILAKGWAYIQSMVKRVRGLSCCFLSINMSLMLPFLKEFLFICAIALRRTVPELLQRTGSGWMLGVCVFFFHSG